MNSSISTSPQQFTKSCPRPYCRRVAMHSQEGLVGPGRQCYDGRSADFIAAKNECPTYARALPSASLADSMPKVTVSAVCLNFPQSMGVSFLGRLFHLTAWHVLSIQLMTAGRSFSQLAHARRCGTFLSRSGRTAGVIKIDSITALLAYGPSAPSSRFSRKCGAIQPISVYEMRSPPCLIHRGRRPALLHYLL